MYLSYRVSFLKKLEDAPHIVAGIMKNLEWNWVEMMYMDNLQLELKISRMTWLLVEDDVDIVSGGDVDGLHVKINL
jgi:hypothetical protein